MTALAVFIALPCHSSLAASLPTTYTTRLIDVPVNDIVFDASRNQILASVPSLAGWGLGNTISHFSADGNLLGSTFIGSEPGVLDLSDDNSILYVGLKGAPMIRQYDVANRSAGAQFTLGMGSSGALYAEDIEVLPGSNTSIAVAMRYANLSPRHAGVAVFDDGQKRAAVTNTHTGSNSIAFGDDPQILYGYNNESSEFGVRTMSVTAMGVETIGTVRYAMSNYYTTMQYADGLLYASNGEVYDPDLGFIVGSYTFSGTYYGLSALTPDTARGLVYGASGNMLIVYDLATYVPLQTYTLNGHYGTVSEILTTPDGQLALRTSNMEFLVLTPVPEASNWAMMGLGLLFVGFAHGRQRKRRQNIV